MNPSDDHPPIPDRPSHHAATSPHSERGRPRVFGGLDAMEQDGRARDAQVRRLVWAFLLALFAAGAVGAALWIDAGAEKQIIIARSEAPPLATPPLLERAAPPEPAQAPAQAPDPADAKLVDLRADPPALETRRVKAKPVARKKAAPKPKAKAAAKKPAVAKSRTRQVAVVKKETTPRTEAMPPADRDVALLTALVQHTKSTQPAHTALALKLRQCRALPNPADAASCRSRACTGEGRAPAECGVAGKP